MCHGPNGLARRQTGSLGGREQVSLSGCDERAVARLCMTSPMPFSASGSSKSRKPRSAAHTAASSSPTTRASPARVTDTSATAPHGVAPPCSLPSKSLARSAHLVGASGRGRDGAGAGAPLSSSRRVGARPRAGAGAGAPLRCLPTRRVVGIEGDDGCGERSHVVRPSTKPELLRILMTRIPQQRSLVPRCRGVWRGVERCGEVCGESVESVEERCEKMASPPTRGMRPPA